MLFSVEQAVVGREEIRAPLKTPAWEARSTLGTGDFSSAVSGFWRVFAASPIAEDVSAFGQHRKFSPHAGKTSCTQGRRDLVEPFKKCHRDLGEIKETSPR